MYIQEVEKDNRDWIRSLLCERWGASEVVTRGRLHRADQLPGFIAFEEKRPVGLITYTLQDGDCEIVSLDSLETGKGIGSALVKAVMSVASTENCRRVWLITTNDNTAALCFYQKVGFELVTIHQDAVKKARRLKPAIPEIGLDGIPIKHEIELEIKMK